MHDIQPVSDNIHNILGEGIVWDAGASLLLWTDIEQSELWTLDSSGDIKLARVPERIGSFAPCESGGIVAAFASGFAFWDPRPANVKILKSLRPTCQPRALTMAGPIDRVDFSPAALTKKTANQFLHCAVSIPISPCIRY